MSSLIRPVAVFGVITLAIGFTAATAFLASARDSPPSRPDICTTTDSGVSDEAPFLAENESAMNKMMSDMAVKPTGDVDVDFVAMMVPHHQGAVDLAQAELKYGHNERLRRLAQQIIANRQSEITVMRLAVDDEQPLPAGSTPQSVPPSDSPAASHATMGIAHDAKPHN